MIFRQLLKSYCLSETVLFTNKIENPLSLPFLKTMLLLFLLAQSKTKMPTQSKTQWGRAIFGKSTAQLDRHAKPSGVILSNKTITCYIRSRDLDSALNVFTNMAVKSTVTWNSVSAGFSMKRWKLRKPKNCMLKIPEP